MKENYHKALCFQQPWAWAILYGGKDVDNRGWRTKYRGQLLVHAGKTFDWKGYQWIMERESHLSLPNKLPSPTEFYKGGFVGAINIVNCVEINNLFFQSKWFFGPWGFVLENPIIFDPPVPYPGELKIFNVPEIIIPKSYLTNK